MLQAISWKDFSITIVLLTGLYYGWWLVRYGRRKLTLKTPEGKPAQQGRSAQPVEPTQTGEPILPGQSTPPAKPPQSDPAQSELPFPKDPHTIFLAAIAANCSNDVVRLLDKTSAVGAKEAELLELIRSLLTADPYPKLKGTILQENIDALICRELQRYGSIHPTPEAIRQLWEEAG